MKQTIQKLLMVMAMLFSFLTMSASAFEVDGLNYRIISSDDRTVAVTGTAKSDIEDLEIPASVMNGSLTYNVIAIDREAFYNHECLQSIKIPNSVTSIGKMAFYLCKSLTSINIPNSVTSIGESAFYGCLSLTSIDIPSSLTSISDAAFFGCLSLTSIDIPNSVTSIGSAAFSGCSSLSFINIPNSVTLIDSQAFLGCSSLTSINIPSSVTSIGEMVFGSCTSLATINIPSSVTSIGDYVFSYCSNIENIYCYWDSPIEAGNSSFENEVLKNAILHVPMGTKDNYEKVSPWQNFRNIEETDYSGIDAISDDSRNCKINVFDISGNLVMEGCHREDIEVLPKGIYILVSKDKTEKVVR